MRVYFINYLDILFKVKYSSNLYRICYPLKIKKHISPIKVQEYNLRIEDGSYANSVYHLLELYTSNNEGIYPIQDLFKLTINKGNIHSPFNFFPVIIKPEFLCRNGWKEIGGKEFRFPKTHLIEFENTISQVYCR